MDNTNSSSQSGRQGTELSHEFLQLPSLGQPFELGLLYDCRSHSLISGTISHFEPVPYTLPLKDGLPYGSEVTIFGEVKRDAHRIAFDFFKNEDIAFHFNIRFDGKVVVRNSLISGRWGYEERDAPLFPFVQGRRFQVRIRCTPQNYQVTVNNQHFINYNHRINELNEIKALRVRGDLILHKIKPCRT